MTRSFFNNLERTKQTALKSNDQKVLKVLDWVESWIKTNSFSSYKKVGTLVNNYTLSNKDLAVLLGVSERTAKNARLDVSKELYNLFGYNFFDNLLDGSQESQKEVQDTINFLSQGASSQLIRSDLLVQVALQVSTEPFIGNIRVEDCGKEILFLKEHTVQKLLADLETVNPHKVSFLLQMLDGKAGETKDRVQLVNYLTSKGKEGGAVK